MSRKFSKRETMGPIATVSDREAVEKITRLQSSIATGRIGRRDFMTAAIALGFSTTAASTVFNKAWAAAKKGGRLRIGTTGGATSDVLDPGLILDSYMINVLFGQVRNNLSEVSATGDLVPELAESWDSTPDAKVWTFKIRQGVEFHNGKTLDSQDVVDSIRHHLTEDSKSAAKGILGGIESVEADGKHAVKVTLKGGDADFPFLMSDYHVLICPSRGDGTIDWESGTGTGGYALVEHEPGIRTFTRRNPNYWKEGRAHFDEVETLQIADPNARLNALRTKSVDCINNVDLKIVERLKRVPGLHVRAVTGNKQLTLPMRTDTPPFDNQRRSSRHQERHQSGGVAGEDHLRLRGTRERQPHRSGQHLPCHHRRAAAAGLRPGQGEAPSQAGRPGQPERPVPCRRNRLRRCGQRRATAAGVGPCGGHRHRGGARAG